MEESPMSGGQGSAPGVPGVPQQFGNDIFSHVAPQLPPQFMNAIQSAEQRNPVLQKLQRIFGGLSMPGGGAPGGVPPGVVQPRAPMAPAMPQPGNPFAR